MRPKSVSVYLVGGLVMLLAGGAQAAALLDLDIGHLPRVFALVRVTYVADGRSVPGYEELPDNRGLLTVDGEPWTLFEEGGPVEGTDIFGTFHVEAVIDTNAGEAVSGKMDIIGDPDGSGTSLFLSETLKVLPSERLAFGAGGNDILDFIFLQEGASGLAPFGYPVGVKIFADSIPDDLFSGTNPPDFKLNFANTGNGLGNAFYLPEPASLSLLALGALAMFRRRR